MKCVEATFLLGICRPCLTAVQQDAEDTSLVHLTPSVQSGYGGTSFADAFVYLDIGGQVAGDG